jgi:hypothetical protein
MEWSVAGSVVEEVDRQAGGPDRALGRSGKVAPDHAGHGRFYGHCNNWSRCTPTRAARSATNSIVSEGVDKCRFVYHRSEGPWSR